MTKTLQQLREAVERAERDAQAADDAMGSVMQWAAFAALRGVDTGLAIIETSQAQTEAHRALRAARIAYAEACRADSETAPLARDNKPFSIFKS